MKAVVNTDILFYALRYTLGRQTYAVGTVVEELIENWSVIPLQHKMKMQEEIRTAIHQNQAGADMDVKAWKTILRLDCKPSHPISINIWDDYNDNQDTFAQIEGGELNLDEEKEVLEEFLKSLKKITSEGVETKLVLKDPLEEKSQEMKDKLILEYGKEIWGKKWKIEFKNLSHGDRESLVTKISLAKLKHKTTPLEVYSES